MALNRATIITNARDALGTDAADVLTPARLYRRFNRLQRDYAQRTLCLSAEVQPDLAALQQTYDLTALTPRAFQIRKVRILLGAQRVPLAYRAFERMPYNFDQSTITGTPWLWSTRDIETLYVYPTPSRTVTGGLFIDTYNLSVDLAEDSSADFTPLEFATVHEAGLIAGMALAMCEMNLTDPTLAARLPIQREEFMRLVNEAREMSADPSSKPFALAGDLNRSVENTSDPYLPTWWRISDG